MLWNSGSYLHFLVQIAALKPLHHEKVVVVSYYFQVRIKTYIPWPQLTIKGVWDFGYCRWLFWPPLITLCLVGVGMCYCSPCDLYWHYCGDGLITAGDCRSHDPLLGLFLHHLNGKRERHLMMVTVKKFAVCSGFSFLGSLDKENKLCGTFFPSFGLYSFAFSVCHFLQLQDWEVKIKLKFTNTSCLDTENP